MTRTFLVAVEISDGELLADVAEDIANLLGRDFEVSSVQPWASPGQATLPEQTTTNTTTQTQ